MSETDDTEIEAAPSEASREEYAAFISQIELGSIWLVDATIQNHAGPDSPREASLQVEHDPFYSSIDSGFRAFSPYKVSVRSEDDTLLSEIVVTFAADFESPAPVTDSLFALFGPINLPLNTWPYLREFVSTTFSRMNWHPFTMPALKRGTNSTAGEDSSKDSTQSSSDNSGGEEDAELTPP
jgi:hypothetical protein